MIRDFSVTSDDFCDFSVILLSLFLVFTAKFLQNFCDFFYAGSHLPTASENQITRPLRPFNRMASEVLAVFNSCL